MPNSQALRKTTSNHPAGISRAHAKDRARTQAFRSGDSVHVVKQSFRDMSPSYRTEKTRPASGQVVFTARPVEVHTSPKRFWRERRIQKVRAGLRWKAMKTVCEETEPPEEPDSTLTSRYARRLWCRHPQALIALRKFRALGERPSGRVAYIDDVLCNDIVSALEGKGSVCLRPEYDGATQGGGEIPMAFHVLRFVRKRWDKKLRWGDESTVREHSRQGGDLTHYSYPGLSSPLSEIVRQYKIMRRFQEKEREARRRLREDFGLDFIDRYR